MSATVSVAMSAIVGAVAGGAAAARAIHTQRVLAGGVIIEVDPETFMKTHSRLKDKGVLVIHGVMGMLSKTHVYLMPYQGVVFLTKSSNPLPITPDIDTKRISLPPGV